MLGMHYVSFGYVWIGKKDKWFNLQNDLIIFTDLNGDSKKFEFTVDFWHIFASIF
jgi:hypothetical protein